MKKLVLLLIRFYQAAISPWLGRHCRFYPSCSEWARQAVESEGIVTGFFLSLKRLSRCHPFHPGGYEPFVKSGALHG